MNRLGKLRAIYWLALANLILVAVWGVAYDVPGMLGVFASHGPRPPASMIYGFMAFGLLVGAILFGLLIWRPVGLGKLLLVFAGLSWSMHAAIIALMGTIVTPPLHVVGLWVPMACAAMMFALAIAHQVIDPSFVRSPI